MSTLRAVLTVSACALLASTPGSTQQPKAAPPPTSASPSPAPQAAAQQSGTPIFRTGVEEVIVPVTVTDDKGKYVSNLVAKDFRILDEGKPQTLEFFSNNQKQPIVVGFLVDMSNNTKVHWKRFQEAVESLVFELLPGDKRYSGYLIQYANDAEILVNTTSDFNKIADKLRRMRQGGGAAFLAAVYSALRDSEWVP